MEPAHDDQFKELTSVWDEGFRINVPILHRKRKEVSPSLRDFAFCRCRKLLEANPRVHPVTKRHLHRESSKRSLISEETVPLVSNFIDGLPRQNFIDDSKETESDKEE